HIIGMARAVDMRIVALLRLVLDMRRRDRDAARLLLRRLVDLVVRRVGRSTRLGQNLGDRCRQRRLAMIDMADRPDVAVRLIPLKFRLRHALLAYSLGMWPPDTTNRPRGSPAAR